MFIDTALNPTSRAPEERNVSGGPKGRHSIAMMQKDQPEGLSDSSRWSKQSEDHRTTRAKDEHPGGVQERRWHPAGVRSINECIPVVRFASTTGYFLLTLRVRRAVGSQKINELLPEAELNHEHPRSEKIAGRLGRQNGKLKRNLE